MQAPIRPSPTKAATGSASGPASGPASERLAAAVYRLSDTSGTLSTLEKALAGHDDFSSTVRLVGEALRDIKDDLASLADELAS